MITIEVVGLNSGATNNMVIILIGVSGSGKTTIGQALSALTGWLFVDADDYHSPANIAKMARGEALSDTDRGSWLNVLETLIAVKIARGEQMILACSALKKAYRVQLAPVDLQSVRFVYLQVSPELLQVRLERRQGHFMQATMLCSQLATLEAPDPSEALIIEVQADTSPQLLAISIQNRLKYYYSDPQ